jgi:glycosyl transferase family 2
VFIQDRTVIEDTGSTVDVIRRGWRLYNYPERLAYSATPPDFGALIIQRRRWSNGGLIILSDLIRYLWASGRPARLFPEAAMRAYYLCSPAMASFALLTLLIYRFDDSFANAWLPLAALPYYVLYGRDMRFAGYRWSDLFRVYALNLLLLPVNAAGVLLSLRQLVTGRKAPFGRTPKVQSRTAVPPAYALFHATLLLYLVGTSVVDLVQGLYSHAGFALASSAFLAYAIGAFVGWRESCSDLIESIARPGQVAPASLVSETRIVDALPVAVAARQLEAPLAPRMQERS